MCRINCVVNKNAAAKHETVLEKEVVFLGAAKAGIGPSALPNQLFTFINNITHRKVLVFCIIL